MKTKKPGSVVAVMLVVPLLVGFVKPFEVNLGDLPKVDRWATGDKATRLKKTKGPHDPLMKMGLSRSIEDWQGCIKFAKQVSTKSPVKDWAVLFELECAKQLSLNTIASKGKIEGMSPAFALKETIALGEKYISEWKDFPTGKKISQDLIDANILLCQWLDGHSQWKDLRIQVQKVLKMEESLTRAQKSQAYFFAGNLLVAERQWSNAFLQFQRAQEFNPSPEIESRLKAILPMLSSALRQQIELQMNTAKSSQEPPPVLLPSADEKEQFDQAQGYLARNDITGALASLSKLIKSFPLGVKSKWAQDKMFEMLVQEIEKSNGPNGESVGKKRIQGLMLDFDAERQVEWGKSLFDLQYYAAAAPILNKAADQSSGVAQAARAYFMAGRAYQLSQNYPQAKTLYRTLVKNYPMAPEVVDGAIQWALININENDASEAISHLEMARARKITSQQDLISLFWLYQSYKLKKAELEAAKTSAELVKKYPLTYYGLIASQEVNKGLVPYEKRSPETVRVNFSDREMLALTRAKILLSSGLLDSANEELLIFSTRNLSPAEGRYLAGFYAQSLHYSKAFSLLNSDIEDLPEKRTEFVIKQLFPKEFWEYVTDDSKRSNLDPLLLLSVMKQESAFDFEAVSRSGAVGLLQMIPPTADDVKKELNSKAEMPRELFDPGTNIRYCAYYLASLIKKFNGSIPVALAAYNAGPKRITMFMNSHGPLTDTWVDELPWSEPSFYVKSILKNYIVYRMLYAGLTQLPSPPWTNSPLSSSGH